MKRTSEQLEKDKRAFFALYIDKEVARHSHWNVNKKISSLFVEVQFAGYPGMFLELTSIADISDEDATESSKIYEYDLVLKKPDYIESGKRTVEYLITEKCKYGCPYKYISLIDYLRSKGYLLPFKDYSIEEILQLGWAKVKQK